MLILHRSERADRLVDALAELLADPLADPVVAEVVAVPTRGVERWITQRLSHRLGAQPGRDGGVCANLDFPFPGSLVSRVTAQAAGYDPDTDPWAPDRLVWPLIRIVDQHADDPRLAPLLRHLADATPPARPAARPAARLAAEGIPAAGIPAARRAAEGTPPARSAAEGTERVPRRFPTLRHLADLFDRYAVHRPDLVRAWASGDAGGSWQAHLWRLVRAELPVPSPAERMETAVGAIAADPSRLDLPERLSVFGLTRLPAGHLAVLDAVARDRDVHLFLLHPSGALWSRTEASLDRPFRLPARAADPTARLARHPLLRSWGRDAREMQLVLSTTTADSGLYHPLEERPDASLLARIQADVRQDRAPSPGDAGHRIDPADRSVQVHSCHGRLRQVEVLRDALLHVLQDTPDLEPRDVIVMCPDIETYAPLVHAAFGVEGDSAGHAGSPAVRVRLADRALRQTNPLLTVAAELLELAGSRVSAPQVLDLLGRPAVARRFRFDQEDLADVERWVADSGVRWGLDAGHRRPWALERLDANTWSAGLDRLMLGVAMAESGGRMFADTVPFDDMTSGRVDLAGRFAEFVARLASAIDRLTVTQPVAAWVDALVESTVSLAAGGPDEDWQYEEMQAALGAVAADTASGPPPLLGLDEIRALLGEQLQGRPTRANFRTGDLTICTLVPMRSVPHRVVALLGLDDGTFPRHPEIDGDDLLLADPRVGDRDSRAEDRQLLLDALLAATDHLIITYSGRDERTNRGRPPCPPVAELLDVIDATATTTDGRPGRQAVIVEHPLQPFDARNFIAGLLTPATAWSFDPVYRDGAQATVGERRPPGHSVVPLPALHEPVLELEHLVAFVQHPVRAFLRRRLSLYLGDYAEDLRDEMPLALDPLERWALGDRLLEAVLGGTDLAAAVATEQRRGFLPPGELAGPVLEEVGGGVVGIAAALLGRGFGAGPSESAQVRISLPDGRSVVGTIPQVRDDTIVQCVYSRLAPKHRLAAWVRFLALTADRPDSLVRALSIGKGAGRAPTAVASLPAVAGTAAERRTWAVNRLATIVDLYERGMRSPLPLVCDTSSKWAEGRKAGLDEDELLSSCTNVWASSGLVPGDRDDPEHILCFGRYADFRGLLAEPPAADEGGRGWPGSEPHRFGRLAGRLWAPLLAHEELTAV